MKTVKLKPSFSKIVLSGLIMGSVIFLIFLMLNRDVFTDISLVAIALIYVFLGSFIFCVIFFNLPHFVVEISDTHLFGPYLLGPGWRQTQIPIEYIDIKNIKSFQWLGFYIIKSTEGGTITVCCFDKNQLKKLITIITGRLAV